ncbi:hypothetical protein GCM10023188_18340 [Pontibacter saemangeumensis]|uniref:LVIVD repeat-containing protein n=1 Tax=Pontibacter saemangeumensis TaxID=1084525 RepID=A0ABP8LLL0_9BACT
MLLALLLCACSDDCETTITYTVQEPVYMLRADLREAVQVTQPRVLENPGKIYALGHYLFVNEVNEGVHVIDNQDPASPRLLSFIQIPGNIDMAVKDNILYADSYIDLVALDITNPLDVKEVKRVENIFPSYGMLVSDTSAVFVSEFVPKTVTEAISSDCDTRGRTHQPFLDFTGRGAFTNSGNSGADAGGGATNGKGGSMARFTVAGNHLYTVSLSNLQVFDVSSAADPKTGTSIPLGWNIETIFPYQNKLFIGSSTGMHIYDSSNPSSPALLSIYEHVRSCDPVVVEGDLAWVTLRSGNACMGFTNQLEVVDISDPRSPTLLKTYPMLNPHGLGIDGEALFLCEGTHGLKVFNIKDHLAVDQNLLSHFKEQDAFDVIPLGETVLMVGQDGLYQYDYRDLSNVKLLSVIPVQRKTPAS